MADIRNKSAMLSVSERKELRKLVEQEFAIFQRELKSHEDHIAEIIREEIVVSYKAKLAKAERLFEAFQQFCRDNDLSHDNIYADRAKEINIRPRRLDEKVKTELRKLRNERGVGAIELDKRKNHILTEITLGSVRSSAMQEILDAIPSVVQALPSVTATEVRKQLKAGS